MRYLIFILLLSSHLLASDKNEDIYITPPEVLEARDKLLASIDKMYKYIDSRIVELSIKQELTLQEMDELNALQLVRYGTREEQDRYLKIREYFKKNPKEYKLMQDTMPKPQLKRLQQILY